VWGHDSIQRYGAKADGRGAYIQTYLKNLDWETVADRLMLADQGRIRPRDAVLKVV